MSTSILNGGQVITILLTILCCASCASIVSDSQYPLMVTTDPPGAMVTISDDRGIDLYVGPSPAQLYVEAAAGFFKKARYVVTVEVEGYEKKIVPVTCKVDGWYWGNLLFGGIIGMLIVDPATGSMYKLRNENIAIKLSPNPLGDAQQLQIIDIASVPEKYRGELERLNGGGEE